MTYNVRVVDHDIAGRVIAEIVRYIFCIVSYFDNLTTKLNEPTVLI